MLIAEWGPTTLYLNGDQFGAHANQTDWYPNYGCLGSDPVTCSGFTGPESWLGYREEVDPDQALMEILASGDLTPLDAWTPAEDCTRLARDAGEIAPEVVVCPGSWIVKDKAGEHRVVPDDIAGFVADQVAAADIDIGPIGNG